MKRYIKVSFTLLVTVISFSSCLKQKNQFEPANSASVIELGDPAPITEFATADYPINVYSASFDVVPAATYSIPVKYSGGAAPQDITVTLALDNTILTKYNTFHERTDADAYQQLPAAYFSVPSYTVTIPKGQSSVNFTFSTKPDQFGFSQAYGLGIKIASVSSGTISGNFGQAMYVTAAKNKWDGKYTVTGTFKDLLQPAFSSVYPVNVELRTTGASTVSMYNADYGIVGYVFNTGTGVSYYGNFNPVFTFDPATNKVVSVTNSYGQATNTSRRAAALDATGTNVYDPSAKTIKVKYFMVQAGANRSTFDETYTFTGAR